MLKSRGIFYVAAAILAALIGLTITGAAATDPNALLAQYPLVSWGLPVIRVVHHAAMVYVIGVLFTVVLFLPATSKRRGADLEGVRLKLTRCAAWGSVVWFLASLVMNVFFYLDAVGSGTGATQSVARIFQGFLAYAVTIELGQVYAFSALAILIAGHFLFFARRINTVAWGAAFSVFAVLLLGLAGHAGSSTDHANAVNALAVHILAVCIWVGVLSVSVIHSRLLADDLQLVLQRFSPWALGSIIAVGFSGFVNALIRMNSLAELATTRYGIIVLLKTFAILALAVFGYLQRRHAFVAGRKLTRLSSAEVILMALVIGLSVALSRSAPPVPQSVPANLRVEALVGYAPPAEAFDLITLFTKWQLDWVLFAVALAMAGFYVAGVARLHRRGDKWPVKRTVFWLLGCLAFIWVMNGGPAAYGMVLFQAHMVQHMALMMVVPPLWVLGAPVTLLSRAMPPRIDGSRGIREWVLVILHSRYSRYISYAPVAGAIFAGSLVLFYFTGMFTLAMFYHAAHIFMTVHFLLSGYLFCWVLIGVDPSPHPLNHTLRLVTLLVTLSFHAFFGVAVISSVNIIGAEWYHALGMFSDAQLMVNQAIGGSIMWGISEIPTVLLGFGVVLAWTRDDDRRARQWDRKADRDGDAELKAYNERLKQLARNE